MVRSLPLFFLIPLPRSNGGLSLHGNIQDSGFNSFFPFSVHFSMTFKKRLTIYTVSEDHYECLYVRHKSSIKLSFSKTCFALVRLF